MIAFRYLGHPDDDHAPAPMVDGKPLKVGDLVHDDMWAGDLRFVQVLDPDAAVQKAKAPAKGNR